MLVTLFRFCELRMCLFRVTTRAQNCLTDKYKFMEKNLIPLLRKERIVFKILLIMRLTLLLCLLGVMGVQASIYSQNTKLNLSYKNTSIKNVLNDIKSQSKYEFFYNNDDFDTNVKVDIEVKNGTVEEVLNKIISPAHLQYRVIDNIVIISSAKKEAGNAMQQQSVKGRVTDEQGKPVPGVTITILGTTRGVITDNDGTFKIDAKPTDKLLFSFIGMESQTINVGNQVDVTIKMKEKSEALDDITIVAFGKQKKESVIGSITTIKPSELKIPSSNLTTALAGSMAGIIAYQRSGEPGQDNADFFVRGITTFGTNTNPLILIDGIELTSKDLARLQPDDIASFSIMKDATATALYGARGANGVILVTTKQGKEGPAKISVRLENSLSAPTQNVEIADPVTYMKLNNEAVLTRDPLGMLPYTEEKIANTEAGLNKLVYPTNNWRNMLFKDYTMNKRANLNVSGGGGVARYYVAGSFNQDNGVLNVDKRNNFNNNIDLKNYSLRANVNIDISKTTELLVRLSGNFDDYTGPINGGADMYSMVMRSNPVLFPAYFPNDESHKAVQHIMFGNYDKGQYLNPYAQMVKGYKDESRSQMLAQFELKQDLAFLTEGLSIRGMANVTRTSNFDVSRYYNPFWYGVDSYDRASDEYIISQINTNGTEYLGYNEGAKYLQSTSYFEGMANYNRTFKKNSVSGLLVFVARQNLLANAGDLQSSLPSRNVGLSGRATYSYDNRFFGEFNFGYNGSERFYKTNRFGFFPSAGLAWNVSNEPFWEPVKSVISNLKLRYSYGLVGNDQIGSSSDRFFYLSNVNMNATNRAATFGRDLNSTLNGVYISRYANREITWETSTKQNFAVELSLLKKINIIAEYFTEDRSNILMTREAIPTTMGLSSVTKANVGEASGKGVDLSLDYQQVWNKDFWTSARANFTYATSKYEVYDEPEYNEYWRSRIGNSLNQKYGYIAERLFVDDTEAANSPKQEFGGTYGGGDIKYTDVNRDGKITEADKVPIGNPTVPEIVYGFGFSMGYKNFDLSAFFQGAANESFWLTVTDDVLASGSSSTYQLNTSPFRNETQILKAYADSHWSEDNRNVYATWPRLSTTTIANNAQPSTWFMRDGTFLRFKQLEIGYTLPQRLRDKLHTSNLRLYVSGTNLMLFSKFKMWDVEMAGNGLGYPLQRVFNLGLNISFN
jgi:TonB-linked SusC/RagA family outer membrane protein